MEQVYLALMCHSFKELNAYLRSVAINIIIIFPVRMTVVCSALIPLFYVILSLN